MAESIKVQSKSNSLDLNTLVPTEEVGVVTPDGEFYQYANIRSWGIRPRTLLNRTFKRVQDLETMEDPTEADDIEYQGLLDELVHLCVPNITDESLGSMDISMKSSVVLHFLVRSGQAQRTMVQPLMEAATGAKAGESTRASKRSTGARRKTG